MHKDLLRVGVRDLWASLLDLFDTLEENLR